MNKMLIAFACASATVTATSYANESCEDLLLSGLVRPAVQIYVLANHQTAHELASRSGTVVRQGEREAIKPHTMVLYFQQRQNGLSFANQLVPPGGILDTYDIAGRKEFPEFIRGPVKSKPRQELEPGFRRFIEVKLSEIAPPQSHEEARVLASRLDSAVRAYVATADPPTYATQVRQTLARELREESGLLIAESSELIEDQPFQIGSAHSDFNGQSYSFEQWAIELRDPKQVPRVNSPAEAAADMFFTVYGAIEAHLAGKQRFAPRVWEVLIEMGLLQRELGDSGITAYREVSSRRKYYRGLIQNYGSKDRSFSELTDAFAKTAAIEGSAETFLAFVEKALLQDTISLRGLGLGGVGFALVPLNEQALRGIGAKIDAELPEICVTSDFMHPGMPRKRPTNDASKDPMRDFPIVEINGSEAFVKEAQELGLFVERFLNEHSPMADERGLIELYYGEVRRTSADGPRLPPTVFHYDSGKTLFLNVVVTIDGALTVVDLLPPLANLVYVEQDYVYGSLLEPPRKAQMTEPGFAVVNSTSTRVRFYRGRNIGASYHTAPDYPGKRTLLNYKFKISDKGPFLPIDR